MGGSRSNTPTPRDYARSPQTPPPRRPNRLNSRMRSDSSVSAIIMTPEQPSTPTTTTSRPVSGYLDNHEQDMADLNAEMALLDDGFDSRTGRTITSRSGTGLRPLSLQYKPLPRPISSSDSDHHPDSPDFRNMHTPTSRPTTSTSISTSTAPVFYSVGGTSHQPTPLTYPEKPPRSGSFPSPNSPRFWGTLGKACYRARVLLRLLNVMGAGCVLGTVAHVTTVYERTKNDVSAKTGADVWPGDGLDLMPTHALLAVGAVGLAAGLGWLGAGLHGGVRRLDGGCAGWVRWVAGLSAAAEVGLWVLGLAYAGHVKDPNHDHGMETLFWVCDAMKRPDGDTDSDDDNNNKGGTWDRDGPVDFQLHCGELRAGWFAALGTVIVSALILLTIVLGKLVRWWQRRRKGKGRMVLSGGFEEVSGGGGGGAGGLRGLKLVGGGKATIGGMARAWKWGGGW